MADSKIGLVVAYWLDEARKSEDPFAKIWVMVARQAMADYLRIRINVKSGVDKSSCPDEIWRGRVSAYRFLFDHNRSGEVDLEDLCQFYGPPVECVRGILVEMADRREQLPRNMADIGSGDDHFIDRSKKMDHTENEGD